MHGGIVHEERDFIVGRIAVLRVLLLLRIEIEPLRAATTTSPIKPLS